MGKRLGRKTWVLDIKSVGEATHAINRLTKGKLYRILSRDQKNNIKYGDKINNSPFKTDKVDLSTIDEQNVKSFKKQMNYEKINPQLVI